MNKSFAFSLVELLTTVTLVAALMSGLAAASKVTRGESKGATCLDNLKTIASASHRFAAEDKNEQAIPMHLSTGFVIGILGEYEWGGKAGLGDPRNQNDPWSACRGTSAGFGPASRPLNKFIYAKSFEDYLEIPGPEHVNWLNDANLDLPEYRCPSDIGYTGHHFKEWRGSGLSSYDHYGNSYSANALWVSYSMGESCSLNSNSVFLKRLSWIPDPRNTIYYWENCGRFAWRLNYGEDGCESEASSLTDDQASVVDSWHGRSGEFVAAFVDGRASKIVMKGHERPVPRLESYPRCKDGQPSAPALWNCGIIRGDGWQLDTLPEPITRTMVACDVGAVYNVIK